MIIIIPDEQPISWNKLYSGAHWTFRKREADRAHALVRAHCGDVEPFSGPVNIKLTSYRKTRRRFDPDNLCSKLYIDGLVPSVIADDDFTRVNSVTTAVRVDKHNPRLEIEVSAA